MSLAETAPRVPKDSKHASIARLRSNRLEVTLVLGWAQAIRDGYSDLAEWDPDDMPENQSDDDDND